MNSINLMGRLTKSPELRFTTNNVAVCGFTLAVDRDYTPEGQEKQADFFPCVIWQKKGEAAAKYLDKGRRVAVSGRLQTRSWDDTEGKKHSVTEVVVENWYFADDKKKEDSAASQSNPQNGPEPEWAKGAGQQTAPAQQNTQPASTGNPPWNQNQQQAAATNATSAAGGNPWDKK